MKEVNYIVFELKADRARNISLWSWIVAMLALIVRETNTWSVRHVCPDKDEFSFWKRRPLFEAGKISDYTYKMLYSSDGLCSCFYGLLNS